MSLFLTVDGQAWEVERRHEMVQLMPRTAHRERELYLFFHGPGGELRRSEVPDEFPEEPTAVVLEQVWRYAEVLRSATLGEMQSQAGLVMPRFRDVVRKTWYAITLRCPNCGGRGVLRTWFATRERCPACGLRLERGESEDYYLGGIMFNLLLSEGIFAVILVACLIILWPNIPWNGLEYFLLAAAIAAPIVLYPISRLLWLACDLLLRPPNAAEMAWHAASGPDDQSS
jgi:uncharacterized protein (DUF983 family)